MKFIVILFLLAGAAFAQMPASDTPAAPASPAVSNQNQDPNARKARELLDQCIQALGGDAWLNVQDMQEEGRTYSYYQGQPNSLGTVFWLFWKWPDKERVELTKQRDVVYINVGDKGYEVTYKGTAMEEPQALTEYLRRKKHSLEAVLRQWLKEPNVALFYDGPAVAEQKPADSVTLMNGDDAVTLFLNADTHLPIKKTFIWRDKERYKNEEAEIFDAWRPEQGIQTPHSVIRAHNGDYSNQRFITSVKYNQGLADSMFQASITYDPEAAKGKK